MRIRSAKVGVFRTALSFFLCVLLGGCATYPVPKDRMAAIKRIGVVSFLGDTIELREEKMLPIPGIIHSAPFQVESWAIDRYTRELVSGELVRQGTVTIVPFDYDHKVLWEANYNGPEIENNVLRPVLKNDLEGIARRNDLDALVLIYNTPQPCVAEPYQVLPFCLYRYYGLTGRAHRYHVLVVIKVLDGKSLDTLGTAAFYHTEGVEGSFWPPFTDAGQLLALEKKTKHILREKVPLKLKKLGFGEAVK
jgi:hypothetical protein